MHGPSFNRILAGHRLVAVTVVAALIAMTAVVMEWSGTAQASSSVVPNADAYVTSAQPTRNRGTSESLRIDTAPETVRSYLRFSLGPEAGSVTKATLELYADTSSNSGVTVETVADDTWSESTITYLNAPPVGSAVGTSGKIKRGTWTSIDVTTAVQGRSQVSLALDGIGTTAIRLLSRESGSTSPRLVIQYSPTQTTTTSTTQAASSPPPSAGSTEGDVQPGFPMRGAFYYPWFPQAWSQGGVYPYTNYEPSDGYYDGADIDVVRHHIEMMQYGNIQMGISSWWGQGHQTDTKFSTLLRAADGTPFRWSLYYEPEGIGDPAPSTISADLDYLKQHYGADPSALRIDGRLVVFVYADPADGCGMADRWKTADTAGVYVVLKVFSGYRDCASQPDSWHQYGPASAVSQQGSDSYSISPGFWKYGEAPRLDRDLDRWNQNIRDMVASGARFQLVTTFNEWGEGTAVESATAWGSMSGGGTFLDALHLNGQPQDAPTTSTTTAPPPSTSPPPSGTGGEVRLAAVGDIACDPASGSYNNGYGTSSGSCKHKAVADLVVGGGYDAFVPLGDAQYESGTYDAFTTSYDKWFAPVKGITRPVPGNHEYGTAGAAGYYRYFGSAAGDPSRGYYSYDLGSWHIVALNSNCGDVSCSKGSPQETWLRADLAANTAQCTLVAWHHPRYSSGEHGDHTSVKALYQAAYDNGVDVVLSGHDHDYERFAKQDANGAADSRGIRQFVVGSGGKSHYPVGVVHPNSEVQNADTYGVLELSLRSGSYSWRFVPEAGKTFTDAGDQSCN